MTGDRKILACISGNDPSGGAGIQADIETCLAHRVHCLPLISVNTVQDSKQIYKLKTVSGNFLQKQFDTVNADMKISGIKVGLLGNKKQVHAVSKIIKSTEIPVIVDPVFSSGSGSKKKKAGFLETFCNEILPLSTILTPNLPEASLLHEILSGEQLEIDSLDNATRVAQLVLNKGCKSMLVTGGHKEDNSDFLVHYFFSKSPSDGSVDSSVFQSKKLPHQYHGSGCTLATAIAANMINDLDFPEAIENALSFSHRSLENANKLGNHQWFPNRS